ncbi:hypothetical protein AALP_AA6G279700 [Arabis alpina]|uniref:Uncharacterized protein n=1 Tax=Arabis alpina TaxID=50452 RepID=A0A087GS66_ARAAL|nr:hypothetical protein AALP_AA6G279700 [Arabis alpina]
MFLFCFKVSFSFLYGYLLILISLESDPLSSVHDSLFLIESIFISLKLGRSHRQLDEVSRMELSIVFLELLGEV